jgi:hypothetical protein
MKSIIHNSLLQRQGGSANPAIQQALAEASRTFGPRIIKGTLFVTDSSQPKGRRLIGPEDAATMIESGQYKLVQTFPRAVIETLRAAWN